jgi:biopolymer transport protein ExbB/TolQ
MPSVPAPAHRGSRLAYPSTLGMLALAFAFPIGLMVFNPTLMFERGWEQYVGTAIYLWAVLTLTRELVWLWKNERAFHDAPVLLTQVAAAAARGPMGAVPAPVAPVDPDDRRVLPVRVCQLAGYIDKTHSPSATQLIELNSEWSGLDQEQSSGRFTLTKYILYLLPVIGFIGTVEGISKALMNISRVLPMVNDLAGFMSNLTGVTSALQIAFDSTLLALFLSAALMLVQTLVYRRSEDLLARVDRWVVEHVVPRVGTADPLAVGLAEAIGPHIERLCRELTATVEAAVRTLEAQAERWSEGLGPHVDRFAESVGRLPAALAGFQRGADAIGRIGSNLDDLGAAGESLRSGVASLGRIEAVLAKGNSSQVEQLDEIQQGVERGCAAIENLSTSWALAYERSSRATQEQLARTLGSLKDALDLLNVSMEQGNALYRNIVKKMFDDRGAGHGQEGIRAA